MQTVPPMPSNELERVMALSDFDLDYSDLQDKFKDLTKLAAYVAGTEVSLVNLIDSFTQWTVGNFGHVNDQTAREDSVCQYTIVAKDQFEVKDLSRDDRFMDKDYVKGDPHFRYYFGVPLRTGDGHHLGALCVLDKVGKEISPEKVELLKGIAGEIVSRIVTIRVIEKLKSKVAASKDAQNRVAHDIRGPLGGIMNLAEFIKEQGDENKLDDVLEFIALIQKSAGSLLELAEEILDVQHIQAKKNIASNEFNVSTFKTKLEQLYQPQALNKQINFTVNIDPETATDSFPKSKLLQIAGNLISNALKFTPVHGTIKVELDLERNDKENELRIIVQDSGVGMDADAIEAILDGASSTTKGTENEKGYGFGLALVKHLVESMHGTISIESAPDKGTRFLVLLPQRP